MPNIDFDAARRERQRRDDPLTFELGGETFKCRDALGVCDLWNEPPEPPERIVKGATHPVARTFLLVARDIAQLLIPAELDRWWALFDPDHPELIQGEDLLDVLNRLSEEYTSRPTSPSDDSSNGQPDGGTGSNSNSEPDAKA